MESLTVIFVNCQDLGIQIAGEVSPIMSVTEFVTVDPEATLYIVNRSGAVLCTFIGDRAEYEKTKNQDRRVANVNNGFEIVWHPNGMCTVSRDMSTVAKKTNYTRPLICIALALVFYCVGLLIGWAIWSEGSSENYTYSDDEKYETRKGDKDESASEDPKADNQGQNAPVLTPMQKIKADNDRYRSMLQSNDCTPNTIGKVVEWWATVPDDDVEMYEYKFDDALTNYIMFFSASEQSDLYHVDASYFSPAQRNIFYQYLDTSSNFDSLYTRYNGCRFAEPIRDGLVTRR